ncbi:MAG: reverse transcriptase family protein, partial [Candidatus Thiodiazotropha endolucinida]
GSYDSQIGNKIVFSELDGSQVSENGNKLVKMELFSTGNLQEESRLVSTELSELYCRENGKCISSGENDSYIVTTNISECEETNYIQSCTKGLPEYLLPLVENASPSLTDNEKGRLADLITEFSDVFMSPNGQLSQTDLAEHYIDTGDTKPFKTPCHRLPLFKKPIVEAEIKKMLEQKVIEPSVSPWNSPICLVAKKSGEWRFCVDLRALNSVTKLDTYPLPRIDETLDQLSNSKYFSTLDMASGYWQLNLSPQDRDKTSFAIPGVGTFRFRVMCFGLKNAPSSFSRLMEIVLRGLQFDKCLVYLDDIIVMGENFDSELENLKLVLLRFREAN